MVKNTHLVFTIIEEKPKTKVWAVVSAHGGARLGKIYWHYPWNQYVFQPELDCIWSHSCLVHLTGFLGKIKEERKAQQKPYKQD